MNGEELRSLPDVGKLIRDALAEDIGDGDVTSQALVGHADLARAVVVAKCAGVLAGGPVAEAVFHAVDPELSVRRLVDDGAAVTPGARLLEVSGRARSILAAERTALNFLQRLTGIATLTQRYAQRVKPFGMILLDTRKTTPGLRRLEKYAVACGGGQNHRMGLHDRVLIKDNHLVFWEKAGKGAPAQAVEAARRKCPGLVIEIEVTAPEQLQSILQARPDWVLLDNMSPEKVKRCVALCRGICRTEVSGGITWDRLDQYLTTGVDAISIGALTHSAPAADLSLEFEG